MLQVKDLKKLLEDCSDNDYIVISGDVMQSVEIVTGRMREDGYLNPRFSRTPKGKDKAIMFKRFTELSDGTIEVCII